MKKGEVVVITGCNGGIGGALCKEFSVAGYLVVGTDKQSEKSADCELYLSCDLVELVSSEEVQAWFRGSVVNFVARKSAELKAVVNNAALQIVNSLSRLEISDLTVSHQVNVAAPFVLAKLFEQPLRECKGSIVNIGSIHANITKPGFCIYSTTKAALAGLGRALALEFGKEVTVNTISPSATDTAMLSSGFKGKPREYDQLASFHPVGRLANPAEVAHLAVFLCSKNARFITGADYSIDGGIGKRLHDPL